MISNMKEKGVILFIVLGTILIVALLANVLLNIVSSHSRLSFHQADRIQAYYAAQAGMNLALYNLRKGTWVPDATGGVDRYACINGCDVGTPVPPNPLNYAIINDAAIKYKVQITIHPKEPNGIAKLDIKTIYKTGA
jgi:Tfp pilus assembly protein PilX